ncbi:MAG: energy transducer TonB [Verrucomicrobia bacterium]|jgi:hypothetical protein|nr:energy transducer TonB [Verrucomicrobiota bacterium]
MNSVQMKSRTHEATTLSSDASWSRRRWWTLIVLVFAAHVGLIFALGDRKPVTPRPPAPSPTLRLAAESDELLAFNDPTLFALPHRRSFSGLAWLRIPEVKFQPFRWTEPPRLLALPVEKLGATFAQFMQTNLLAWFEFEIKPAPELTLPDVPEAGPMIAARSTLRIAGGLANRRLLNPPKLESWAASDLLTNSVVQVLVNADGNVISSTLLARSGSPKADQFSLDLARMARFEPLRNGAAKLSVGAMIFEWHTVPETNKPATNP